MSHISRKSAKVCYQVRLKLACLLIEASKSLENFGYSSHRYCTVLAVNKKGANQTVQMCSPISPFVVRICHK